QQCRVSLRKSTLLHVRNTKANKKPPKLSRIRGTIKIRKKAGNTVKKLVCGSDLEFGMHKIMSDTKTITAHSNAAIVRGILLKKCASATPRVKPTSTGMLNRISNPELLGRRCNSIGAINS